MINLIPPKAKAIVVKEYWIRVLSVWAILLSVVAGISALLLLPTYVLIRSQLAALEQEVLQQNNAQETFRNAEEKVQDANMLTAQLAKLSDGASAHEVIREIQEAATNAVNTSTFRVSRSDGVIDAVHVQGTADSREALAAFKRELERSPLFSTALVPISDLARETELPFSIKIEMAAQNTE